VLDGVASLIDKSLLRPPAPEQEDPRLYPFEMMRQYGLEWLAACGELEQACDAHAAYYLAFAEKVESILLVADQVVWQERLEPEQENLRAALWWLLERHEGEAALRLAAALRQFWLLGDAVSEGRIALEHALEVCKESQSAVSPAVRAKALYVAGWLAYWQHDSVQATPLLEDSLKLYRSLEDTRGAAAALTCLNALRRDRDDRGTTAAQSKEGARDSRERGEHEKLTEIGVMEGVKPGPAYRSERPSLSPVRLTEPPAPFMYEALTAREGEVLQLLSMGMSNHQIAERLILSRHTVNGHVQSIYGKLCINSRSAATRYALEHHLS
jgi:ATP/maltotriose-dependent transcriptional regulator MalT